MCQSRLLASSASVDEIVHRDLTAPFFCRSHSRQLALAGRRQRWRRRSSGIDLFASERRMSSVILHEICCGDNEEELARDEESSKSYQWIIVETVLMVE
jgi:hypothetical protein